MSRRPPHRTSTGTPHSRDWLTFGAVAGLALVLATAALAAGCGSETTNPPPVEPTDSPPLAEKPAGKVLKLGGEAPELVGADPRSVAPPRDRQRRHHRPRPDRVRRPAAADRPRAVRRHPP